MKLQGGATKMGRWIQCIAGGLIAVSVGIGIALLFPLSLIAGIEALLIVLLSLLICFRH